MSPRTHALIIGVSQYDNLPAAHDPTTNLATLHLRSLESAAMSAAQFARWLTAEHNLPDAPLGSLRLLLSPSALEQPQLTPVECSTPATHDAVRTALLDWRADCFEDSNGVGILYVAGHGVWKSPTETGIILLQDFAADPTAALFENALDVPRVHSHFGKNGAPTRQFYFVDACRVQPHLVDASMMNGAGLPTWDGSVRNHATTRPIFFSAADDTQAYGQPGVGTLFSLALREVLDREAIEMGQPDGWVVRDTTLGPAIRRRVTELAASYAVDQEASSGGQCGGVPFHVCRQPPDLPIVLSVTPPAAVPVAYCTLKTASQALFSEVLSPVSTTVPAGNYILEVHINPPNARFIPFLDSWLVRPGGQLNRAVEVAR